jgi:hypothetical protein
MSNYAVMNGNIVENIIVADTKEIAQAIIGKECIEYTDANPAGIGWTWDGSKFTKPEEPTE